MTEGARTVAVAFLALGVVFAWQSIRTALIPVNAPDRLVSRDSTISARALSSVQ